MQHHDTVVIGAGVAGASVAWHLGGALVLEQGAEVAREATSQNAGMVRRLSEDPIERALAFRSWDFLEQEDWGASTRTGAVLALAHDPWHLHDAVAVLRLRGARVERGSDLEVLQGARLAEVWSLPDERVASGPRLVEGFLRTSTVRCGVQVQRLVVESGRVVGVETDQGAVRADRVVLAAGAWSGRLAATAGLQRRLVPVRRAVMRTTPHRLAQGPWIWLDDLGAYLRPEDGAFLVSGCDEAVDTAPEGPGSTGVLPDAAWTLTQDKLACLPALGPLEQAEGWTGLRTFAPDHRPLLGADGEVDGLWWAAGLGGFGVTCAPGVGQVVAAWMKGETVDDVLPREVAPNRLLSNRIALRPDGRADGARLQSV